jgi:fibronectin-binding autotransporter adhesin
VSAVVQGTYYQYTGAQNVPATLPTLTAGNVMSLSLTGYGFATGVSGGGATWTRTVASAQAANGMVAEIWTGVGYPSSSTPVTITATYATNCSAATDLIEISGTTGAVRSTATTSTADPISLSLTAVAGDLLVANALDGSNVTGSWTGPYSSTGANANAFMSEQAPTTGTITGTFTGGTTSDSCAAVAVAYVALVTTGTLIADYDATTLGAVANGTPITAIQDMAQAQGVNRSLTLASGATPGTLSTTGLNGHPAYVFAGASGYVGTNPALYATGEAYTVVVAFTEATSSPAANAVETLFATKVSGGTNPGIALDSLNTFVNPGVVEMTADSTGTPGSGVVYLDNVAFPGAYTPNVLHVAAVTCTQTGPNSSGFYLGQYPPGGSPFYLNAMVGRVLVYQGALSAADVATVTAALQNQFASAGAATGTAAASIVLSGTGSATTAVPATGSSSIALSGTTAAVVQVATTGTSTISVTGGGTAGIQDQGTGVGSISFTGNGTAVNGGTSTGTGSIAFAGAATTAVRVPSSGREPQGCESPQRVPPRLPLPVRARRRLLSRRLEPVSSPSSVAGQRSQQGRSPGRAPSPSPGLA